ncbi:hypothetical protein llg_11720 [Luteolibacter sp. LG18]|nr:hypothetical protein llg_11720 [Luteolibacter sp. LG18]
MARVLADTNIWLRVADPGSAHHPAAVAAIALLLGSGHDVCLCPQNLIEFWAVATRPVAANGLGWNRVQAATELSGLEARFTLIPETPDIFARWKQLVSHADVHGKRTHDARLVAVCLSQDLDALLTFNVGDFTSFPQVRTLDPNRPDEWNLA